MTILVDSNVVVAAYYRDHIHHAFSDRLLSEKSPDCLIASHSLSEAYNHLTRGPSGMPPLAPLQAAKLITAFASTIKCRAITAAEVLAMIESFATLGGRGARLYDYLIGAVAVLEGADTIATWNVRHFAPLFPALRIATPEQLLES